MPKPPPFPIRVEDLSAEFLSAALDRDVHNFSHQRLGASRGMLGEIFLLDLLTDTGAKHLVAKFAALREGSLASAKRGRNFERELLCYEQLLAETPVRTPTCHGTWYDQESAHFLLLQDVIESDMTIDQVAGIGPDLAKLVVGEMAALHAHWWARPDLASRDWLPRLDGELRLANLTTLARIGWQPLAELLGTDMPALPDGFGEALPARIEGSLREIAMLPQTLLHCDLRADNLLFAPAHDEVTLVDWQGCGIGPAAFDMAYFLVQSLSVRDRRDYEDELIDDWVSALRDSGAVSDRASALAGYAKSLWYGMAIACALPVISDPGEERVRELAHVVLHRTLAALSDHGELG